MSCSCKNNCPDTPCSALNERQLGVVSFVAGKNDSFCNVHQDSVEFLCAALAKAKVGGTPVPATSTDVFLTVDCKLVNLPAAVAVPTLCAQLAAITDPPVAPATGTPLIGKDCKVYAFPDLSIYNLCTQFAAITTAPVEATPTTQFVGKDCAVYTLPAASPEVAFTPVASPTIAWVNGGSFGHSPVANLVISPDVGNALVVNANGLFVAPATAETPLVVNDSSTIDFTNSGTAGHTLTGDIKISTSVGNQIVVNPDGIFVPPAAVAAQTPITVVSSPAIALVVSGLDNHTITATLQPSSAAGNSVVINPDGIYVPLAPAETPLIVVDGSSINFTNSGTAGHTLTGEVKVSASVGNQIVINPDGVFVPPAVAGAQTPITVVDTASVNLTASGIDNHTIQADVKISAAAGNVIVQNADGIFVAPASSGAQTPVAVVDTNTVDLTASGTDNHTIQADVKISSTFGNILTADSLGLYVVQQSYNLLADVGTGQLTNGETLAIVGNPQHAITTNLPFLQTMVVDFNPPLVPLNCAVAHEFIVTDNATTTFKLNQYDAHRRIMHAALHQQGNWNPLTDIPVEVRFRTGGTICDFDIISNNVPRDYIRYSINAGIAPAIPPAGGALNFLTTDSVLDENNLVGSNTTGSGGEAEITVASKGLYVIDGGVNFDVPFPAAGDLVGRVEMAILLNGAIITGDGENVVYPASLAGNAAVPRHFVYTSVVRSLIPGDKLTVRYFWRPQVGVPATPVTLSTAVDLLIGKPALQATYVNKSRFISY